jgi:hypothetical protein
MLKNARHEKFAQLVAGGMSATKAYCKAGYGKKAAHVNGPRLMGNDSVASRVRELKGKTAQKLSMTREDLAQFFIATLQAKPSEAKEDNPLCERIMTKAGPCDVFASKLGAASQLAKLCGWNEPEKQDIGGDGLQQLIAAIRARK